jgi:hypothetical protein
MKVPISIDLSEGDGGEKKTAATAPLEKTAGGEIEG